MIYFGGHMVAHCNIPPNEWIAQCAPDARVGWLHLPPWWGNKPCK